MADGGLKDVAEVDGADGFDGEGAAGEGGFDGEGGEDRGGGVFEGAVELQISTMPR